MPKARVALLIDADNARATSIDAVLADLATYGEVTIRRAYGNWTKPTLKGWIDELHGAAIRPMQQFDLTAQKNASDMALAIDAVELLHSSSPDAFAIVSSDSDFTPLAHYLREKGVAVYGYGQEKTPAPFQSACSKFTVVEKLEAAASGDESPAKRPPRHKLKSDARLMNLLRRSIAAAAHEDGWATVAEVGQKISNQSSLDPRNYGFDKLSELLAAIDLFEVRDLGQSSVSVRDPKASA